MRHPPFAASLALVKGGRPSRSDRVPLLASGHLLNPIKFKLKLSGSFELNVKIATHLIKTCAVFLENLAAFVQQVDNAIELLSGHIEASGFWNPGNGAVWASLGRHRDSPYILMLSWVC